MRRSRVSKAEKRVLESKTNHNSSQRKAMPSDQKVMRKNFSVSMVNTRSAKESKTKVSAEEGRTVPAIKIDLETTNRVLMRWKGKQRSQHRCRMWKNKKRRR